MGTFLKSRAGAARLATPLMILCFLGVAGFLYWLSVTAVSTEVTVEEPEEVMVGGLPFAEFSSGTSGYIGREITLSAVSVTDLLGPHAFWTNLADAQQTAYLLHYAEAVLDDSVMVEVDAVLGVIGTVTAMSDSILDAWEAAGAFPESIHRTLAEFAEDFIEIARIGDGGSSGPPGPSS